MMNDKQSLIEGEDQRIAKNQTKFSQARQALQRLQNDLKVYKQQKNAMTNENKNEIEEFKHKMGEIGKETMDLIIQK